MLYKINSFDSKFVRNYSKVFFKLVFYIVVGVLVVMVVYVGIDKDKELLKDVIYIGMSVVEVVVIMYGMKYVFDCECFYDCYLDWVDVCSYELSFLFFFGYMVVVFLLVIFLSICYFKWYVIVLFVFWVCFVGFLRMNEGVYYLLDVVVGVVIGVGCVVVNIYVNCWFNKWLFGEKKKVIISY